MMTPAVAATMWVLFFGGTLADSPNNTQEFYSYDSCHQAELKYKAAKNKVGDTQKYIYAYCTEK